ncbi:hypothetical protein SLEP1_g22980 [Rubroshorea leprosula]|uniref:Uncharacterized protein n=1 Tax=Rubroshorea leprosula TaxID=152421 RepID=A0AAV5JDY1_9ROSI|nr:hypothetical protein SLEP1_g22980 [Rubroshorea leprosula]
MVFMVVSSITGNKILPFVLILHIQALCTTSSIKAAAVTWLLFHNFKFNNRTTTDVVENYTKPLALPANATLSQMKRHNEEASKPYKALTCLHSSMSDEIFNRIIHCETTKEVWDKIKFHGDDKAKCMQEMNYKREFVVLSMKDFETVKEYSNHLMKLVNQMRVLGEYVPDKRVVEKVLVSLPEKFEHKISSLEDSRDLTKVPLTEIISSL